MSMTDYLIMLPEIENRPTCLQYYDMGWGPRMNKKEKAGRAQIFIPLGFVTAGSTVTQPSASCFCCHVCTVIMNDLP